MKRVSILGITNLSNMGDDLIAESTDFLVKQECPECLVSHYELFRRWRNETGILKVLLFILTCIRIVAERVRFYITAEHAFKLQYQHYYCKIFQESDCVIVTSGMLKYSTQSHAYMYIVLCELAERMKKPLLLNAKSIQRGDESDTRFRRLKKALNGSFIYINTRDGIEGVDILQKEYGINNSCYVGDPALWAKEVYNIKPSRPLENHGILVGVNLIRPDIFHNYGNGISSDYVISFYNSLLNELTNRGYRWQLFCNGMKEDYELVNRLDFPLINKDNNSITIIPHSVDELLHTIISFDIVIGFRLHTCISCVALDVPFVGMIWDNKSKLFAKSIGIERFFVSPGQLEVNHVVDLLKERLHTPLNYTAKNDLKIKCKKVISEFINIRI